MSQSEPPIYTETDVLALFSPTTNGNLGSLTPLDRPVCVPQVDTSFDSPFVRAYTPALAQAGITMDEWLAFSDGLNLAMIGSPPLQVVDKIGMAIGFVPSHVCMAAGIAVRTAAQTGIHIISKSLTDKYLRLNNEKFFRPRKLVVRLVKTPALRGLLDPSRPIETKSKLESVTEVAYKASLYVPILNRVVNRCSAPITPVSETIAAQGGTTAAARRLAQFEEQGLTSELNFDVPPAKNQAGVMDKANALAVKLRESKEARKERKDDQRRRTLETREGAVSSGDQLRPKATKVDRRSEKDAREAEKREAKLVKDAEKRESRDRHSDKDVRKAEKREEKFGREEEKRKAKDMSGVEKREAKDGKKADKDLRKLKSLVEIADRKEYNATDSLVWLVVLNLEQDAVIEGREAADEEGDFLEIPDEEWEKFLESESRTG